MISQLLPFFVIIPVILAVFIYIFFTAQIARILAIGAQCLFVFPAIYLLYITRHNEIILTIGNYESLLGITLRADNLAAVFVALTVIIFLAIGIYTIQTPYDRSRRLYLFLLFLLQGALIGLFLTRDFFNIFVLVEVTTVVVTILLMYDAKKRNLLAGLTFIMVNLIVMQFYLFGLGYLYMMTGTLDLEIAGGIITNLDTRDVVLPYALIMTAIASKCSLLPMLTWLPKVNSLTGAHFTIAAIMSGLHIKSGIYLFIRFQYLFGGLGSEFFVIIGIITALAGIVFACSQSDIRLILAYSTIAQVGLIIVGLSLNNETSYIGALFHIINHSIFKVALFLCASQISYMYKTKNIHKIRGAWRVSPIIVGANIMAILGIIGAPLFNGSISKYFLMYGAHGPLEWVILLINLGTMVVFVRYASMFTGKPPDGVRGLDREWNRIAVVLGLGATCLFLGIFGANAVNFLFQYDASINIFGYLEKSVIFIGSILIAVVLYIQLFCKRSFRAFNLLDGFSLSFNTLCISIGVFFAVLIIVTGMWA